MRSHRVATVLSLAVMTVLALAGPAVAGGLSAETSPTWLAEAIVIGLIVVGAVFAWIVGVGAAQRRRSR